MKKIFSPKILIPTLVGSVMIGLVLYILFAPTTWWKPIYIQIEPDAASANGPLVSEVTPETGAGEAVPQLPLSGQSQDGLSSSTQESQQPTNAMSHLIMPAIQPGQGVMYKLEPKVVNLAEPGGLRYLQASIVLEFHPAVKEYYELKGSNQASQSEAEGGAVADPFEEAINSLQPVIDDIVTTLLSSKSVKEIVTIEGKQALKQELIDSINGVLGYQGVINVYFTDFVIQ